MLGNLFFPICFSRVFLRTVILFGGDEKLEELVDGLERPVRGSKQLICIPEILVLSGRNQLINSSRLGFSLGRTRSVPMQTLLLKLLLQSLRQIGGGPSCSSLCPSDFKLPSGRFLTVWAARSRCGVFLRGCPADSDDRCSSRGPGTVVPQQREKISLV